LSHGLGSVKQCQKPTYLQPLQDLRKKMASPSTEERKKSGGTGPVGGSWHLGSECNLLFRDVKTHAHKQATSLVNHSLGVRYAPIPILPRKKSMKEKLTSVQKLTYSK